VLHTRYKSEIRVVSGFKLSRENERENEALVVRDAAENLRLPW